MKVKDLKGSMRPHAEPDGDEKGLMKETKGKPNLRRRIFGKANPKRKANDHDEDNY